MNLIAIPFRSTSDARCFDFFGAAAFSFLFFILDFFGLDGCHVLLIISKKSLQLMPLYHSILAAHNENGTYWSLLFQDPIVLLLSGPSAVMALLPSALAYGAAGPSHQHSPGPLEPECPPAFLTEWPRVGFWPHTDCLLQQSHHTELFLPSSTICRGSSGVFLLDFTSTIVSSKLSGTLPLGPCQGVKPHINKLPFVLLIVCLPLTQYPQNPAP